MPEGVPYPTQGEDRNVILWPVRNPRPLDKETEIFPGNGLPYAGGAGPLDPAKSVNTAWDAK